MSEFNIRRLRSHRATRRRAFMPVCTGFTLVELLVVIGVITLLIALLILALTKARQVALRTKCLSNMRQLAIGQAMYTVYNHNALVDASDQGEFDITQGSWTPNAGWHRYIIKPLPDRLRWPRPILIGLIRLPGAYRRARPQRHESDQKRDRPWRDMIRWQS